MKSIKTTITAILVAAGLTTTAAAAEWKSGTLLPDGVEAATETDGLYVLQENTEGPAILLRCSDSVGIRAQVFLKGMTQEDLALRDLRKAKTRMVEIDTESTEPKKYLWAYMRSRGELTSVRDWQGKRIFNSVVKGEPINFDIARVGPVTVTPAEMNDAFKGFAKTCEATAPKSRPADAKPAPATDETVAETESED